MNGAFLGQGYGREGIHPNTKVPYLPKLGKPGIEQSLKTSCFTVKND